MPNPKIYTTELERFRTKYNMPDYDLNALMSIDQKFQYLNDFLFTTPVNSLETQFANLMSKTLSMCFEAKTSLRENGKYMFSPQTFLKDFENLANAKKQSELEDGENAKPIKLAKPFKKILSLEMMVKSHLKFLKNPNKTSYAQQQ